MFALFLFTFVIPKFAKLLDEPARCSSRSLTRMDLAWADPSPKGTWWLWLPLLIILALTNVTRGPPCFAAHRPGD